jgi:hypothetical protein
MFLIFIIVIIISNCGCAENGAGRCSCMNRIVPLMSANDYRLIYTPSYPRGYCPNLDCIWRIVAPNNASRIHFYTNNLDIRVDRDSLAFYDGKWDERDQWTRNNASLICSAETECDFVSSGQYMTIRFMSGAQEHEYKGFQGAVQTADHSDMHAFATSVWLFCAIVAAICFLLTMTIGAIILLLCRRCGQSQSRTSTQQGQADKLLE